MAEPDQDSPMPDRSAVDAEDANSASTAATLEGETSAEVGDQSSRSSSLRSALGSNYELAVAQGNSNSNSWDTAPSSSSSESSKDAAPTETSTWFPITEDSSVASAAEIAHIEALGESNALDEKHWTGKFVELNDPEYQISDQGTISFTMKPFNGTQQNPKKNYVYTSDPVRIGGYIWTLKLFPKGLEGPYLAVNLECKKESRLEENRRPESGNEAEKDDLVEIAPASDTSSLPWRVPAQFHIFVYNPAEPRVHYSKSSSQSFSAKSPTCSFKRFAPVNIMDIGLRFEHQRQALLHDDTLAVKAYIRTFKDETGCLFWRGTETWDSLAISGFRGLHSTGYSTKFNQSLMAAVATWLFLPPLRKVLDLTISAHKTDSWPASTHLIAELFDLSCSMTRAESGEGNTCEVGDIESALGFHGVEVRDTADVFEVWELLIGILQEELKVFPPLSSLREFSEHGFARLTPPYDSTRSINDIQGLLARFENDTADPTGLSDKNLGAAASAALILNIQIPRHRFDTERRRWKKSKRAYELNESVRYNGSTYKLYSIILHEDSDPKSRAFSTFVRADGKNFYRYGPDYRRVMRLTRHQTFANSATSVYAATYILDQGIQNNYRQTPKPSVTKSEKEKETIHVDEDFPLPNAVDLTFVDSRAYSECEHPGFMDQYNLPTNYTFRISLTTTAQCRHLIEALENRFLAKEDENKTCYIWSLDDSLSRFRPNFIPAHLKTEAICNRSTDPELSEGTFWVHVAERGQLERVKANENEANLDMFGEDLEDADKAEHNTELNNAGEADKTELGTDQGEKNPTCNTDVEGAQNNSEDTPMTDVIEVTDVSRIETPDPTNMTGTYLFIKYFDPKHQSLKGASCYICPQTATLQESIRENVPSLFTKGIEYEFFEERTLSCEGGVSGARKFTEISTSENQGKGMRIIIVQPVLTTTEKEQIALDGGIAEVSDFVAYMFKRHLNLIGEEVPGQVLTREYFGSTWYQGTFSRGKPHGHGKEVTLSGEEYVGSFKMGLRNGKGMLRLHNNNTYEGDFWNGQPHGTGKHVEVMTGNTYTGGFQRGKKRGRGTTEWQQAEEEAKVCRICYDNEQDCAFYPCGHVCACLECAKMTNGCPMCHKEGSRPFKLYFSC